MAGNTGFVDLQLNGYMGVDFNSDGLSAAACRAGCEKLRADGVAGALATIISDAPERMTARLATLAAIRRQDRFVAETIWGIHLEGPFLNPTPGYAGAHPVEHLRPADGETMRRLLDAAGGLVRLVTLAPECDEGLQVTRFLARRGVVVSAGHCDPTLDQLAAAIDAGVSMFTHLGNGCPLLLPRHDNVIQRVLGLADRLWICFIGDGVHVPYPALGNYLRLTGSRRAIVVSDDTAAAGLGPGRYPLAGQIVEVGADLVAYAADRSHLVGATATMPQVATRLKAALGLTEEEITQLLATNPRRALGMENQPLFSCSVS